MKFKVEQEGLTILTITQITELYKEDGYSSVRMMLFKVDAENDENLSYVSTKFGHGLRDISLDFEAECSDYIVFIHI